MRRTHRRSRGDGANWLSFSDLMSSLLLIFVLIMFYIMYQYFDMYEINMAEIARQQFDLDQANASLEEKTAKLTLTEQQMIAQQIRLEAAQNELEEAEQVLATAQSDLEQAEAVLRDQQRELATAQSLLDEKEQEITEQQAQIAVQQQTLSTQRETLETQQAQLTAQRETLETQQAQLTAQQNTMQTQRETLEEQQAQLSAQQSTMQTQRETLEEQQAQLNAQQNTMAAQQTELQNQQQTMEAQRQQLAQQQATMEAQQSALLSQQQTLEEQQNQIEQLVGLRPRLIKSLSEALRAANISAQVDPTNGSIALESDVLFDVNKFVLTERGKAFVDRFLPVYLNVLLSEEYRPYVTEIIIEGHTDSAGDYINNLKLSQQRALAVASYVLADNYGQISPSQKQILRKLATANGRSESDPVLDAYGREDMDASRRVVFKFRMTDEQMISQLKDIMEQGE